MTRPLTPDEVQVLGLAARGYSAHDIAYQGGADERAVRNTIRRICHHLGARSLDHAVQIHRTSTPHRQLTSEEQQMPEQPTPTVSEYTVNPLPAEARTADWWQWNIYARRLRSGRWVVTNGNVGGEYYDVNGSAHFSVRRSGDHTEADAIALATRVASTMRINGETAVQAAARILGSPS